MESLGYDFRIAQGVCIALCGLLALCLPITASSEPTIGNDVSVLIDKVELDFEPMSAAAIVETSLGKIVLYPAHSTPLLSSSNLVGTSQEGADAEEPLLFDRPLLLGAMIPLEKSKRDTSSRRVAFFISGKRSQLASTAITTWSQEKLQQGAIPLSELEQRSITLFEALQKQRTAAQQLSKQLAELNAKAAKIVDTTALLELRLRKTALEQKLANQEREMARLQELSEQGRQIDEPENIDALRASLSQHLREAASATASADRLTSRRREAALQSLKQKLNLVKQMEQIDRESLAREILALRKKRSRTLERRLSITTSEQENNQF